MKIESVNEFLNRTKKARSTVYRFYKRNQDLWDETIFKSNRRYIPVHHDRYFDSVLMFDENKLLNAKVSRYEHRIKCMKKLLECLRNKDSLAYRLWYMDWTLIGTVSYKLDRSRNSCFNQMKAYYKALTKEFGNRTEIRIFFTTEEYDTRSGHHSHFALNLSDPTLNKEVTQFTSEFFKYDKVECERYMSHKAWLFYISKEGIQRTDWDIQYTDPTEFKEGELTQAA